MQNYIRYGGKEIEYTVVYRERKSVGISVSSKGGVKVSAPRWVKKKQIQDIVEQKAEWIFEKLEDLAGNCRFLNKKELTDDTELFYLGRILYLRLVRDSAMKKPSVRAAADMLIVSLPCGIQEGEHEPVIKKVVVSWYREKAAEILTERVSFFSKILGVKPSAIKIKQQKTRWGSCSSRGNLNFNWKLIMLPADIMDYVVVHELAHLKVLNHSKRFWDLVGSIMPDYKSKDKKLKEYANALDFPE